MTLTFAVLVKAVPRFETLTLGPDGRVCRDGVELEMNPYCRRAVTTGVELARRSGGTCVVFTLGPPSAAEVVREAVAWGADRGVVVSDPAFAGSDTLATSRALVAALRRVGPFDLVLTGRNSVDADTGQVGPQIAEMLGVPFLGGVRTLTHQGRMLSARLEHDDGWLDVEAELPAVVSCAERLCEPAKVPPAGRSAVADHRILTLTASDLGPGPWGQAASPTAVGRSRATATRRRRVVLSGPSHDQVARARVLLESMGALDPRPGGGPRQEVDDGWPRGGRIVAVCSQPDRSQLCRELLGAAAALARSVGGRTCVIGAAGIGADQLAAWGADERLDLCGEPLAEDVAAALSSWAQCHQPWSILFPGTMWGREVAARTAARLGAGLTGDAVELTVEADRLVAWKPAFGGRVVAAITSDSPTQLVTVRPGVLPLLEPRSASVITAGVLDVPPVGRLSVRASGLDDDSAGLARAEVVIGVGAGVAPEEYHRLEPLRAALGAELAATRKVTDRGWLPRARQVGITGRCLGPRLYVAIGISGKYNHMVGVEQAAVVLAVNSDPDAPVFDVADLGIVAPWQDVVPLLTTALAPPTGLTTPAAPGGPPARVARF